MAVEDEVQLAVHPLHPEQRPELVARGLNGLPPSLVAVYQRQRVGHVVTAILSMAYGLQERASPL